MPRGRLVPTQRGRAHRPPRLSPPPPGNARPRPPRGVPGWRPRAGSAAASRGACRCPPPKLQPPGMGTPVPQSPTACASPGMQTTAIRSPSVLPFSAPAPAPGRGPAAFPALPPPRLAPSSRWVAWPPARSPAPGMGRAMARNWAVPGHGANLLPLPAVLPGAGGGGLPAPIPALPCLCRQGGCHRDGVQVRMGKGCCSAQVLRGRMLWTHMHPAQTAPCIRGADEDPLREGWRRLPWPVLDQDQSCHQPRQDWSPPQVLGGSRALFCPSARSAGWGHSCSRWRCRGCPRGVPGQERRGLGKPNWAAG